MPFMKMTALDRHLNLLGNFIVTNITVTTNSICEHLSIASTVIVYFPNGSINYLPFSFPCKVKKKTIVYLSTRMLLWCKCDCLVFLVNPNWYFSRKGLIPSSLFMSN